MYFHHHHLSSVGAASPCLALLCTDMESSCTAVLMVFAAVVATAVVAVAVLPSLVVDSQIPSRD